jgi:hypothetical protein
MTMVEFGVGRASTRRRAGGALGMSRRARAASTAAMAAAALLLASPLSVAVADRASLDHLPGRWSGWGAVTHASGQSEQVKCVATYALADRGALLEQNLRCASASYKIDAVASLSIDGETVRGQWQERTNAASGSVSGRVTGSGFSLSIQGEHFTAVMAVSTSSCKQSINIAPQGVEIQRIAIGLEKC